MLTRVISGGQTGADEAGVEAALLLKIKTGGTMPKGWKTQDRPRPDFAQRYGMVEHPTRSEYPPRTALNVRESDATFRFYTVENSPGEVLTLKLIKQYKKVHRDIDFNKPLPDVFELAKWLKDNNVQTLNIAGNSERTSPGIYIKVLNFMIRLLRVIVSEQDAEANGDSSSAGTSE